MGKSGANANLVFLPSFSKYLFATNKNTTIPDATKFISNFKNYIVAQVKRVKDTMEARGIVFKSLRVIKFCIHLGLDNAKADLLNTMKQHITNDIFNLANKNTHNHGAVKALKNFITERQTNEKKWEWMG